MLNGLVAQKGAPKRPAIVVWVVVRAVYAAGSTTVKIVPCPGVLFTLR